MDEKKQLERITVNPKFFGGKPIIRGRRLAVEHVLSMLAAGDTPETLLKGYDWLEPEDIQACLWYAHHIVGHEPTHQSVTVVDEKGHTVEIRPVGLTPLPELEGSVPKNWKDGNYAQ